MAIQQSETARRVSEAGAVSLTRGRKDVLRRKIFAYVILAIFGFLAFAPFYYMFLLSLDAKAGYEALNWPPKLVPSWKWENYSNALAAMPFGRFFVNTFIITFLSVTGAVITSAAAGYVFARVRLKGKNVLFIIMLATLMVPPQVTLIPQFILFKNLGWINHSFWLPLWVPNWTGQAFAIFLYRQYFMTLPTELEDAARIDGASPLRIFLQIFVPLSKPIIATVAIIVFVGSWGDLLNPIIYIRDQDLFTISVGLAFFRSFTGINITALMSVGMLAVMPPIVMFMLMQGYFVRGVVLTGLKQ